MMIYCEEGRGHTQIFLYFSLFFHSEVKKICGHTRNFSLNVFHSTCTCSLHDHHFLPALLLKTTNLYFLASQDQQYDPKSSLRQVLMPQLSRNTTQSALFSWSLQCCRRPRLSTWFMACKVLHDSQSTLSH